jgi:LmbE family N-acetylglucosaminyl deacetylase
MLLWASEEPNYCLDITDTFDLKIAALRCHKSQISDSFSDELEQELRQRARDMAEAESYKLAEAFHREEILW